MENENYFKLDIGQFLKDSKRNLIITGKEYRIDKNNKRLKWYKYKCNKCGWTEGWISEVKVLNCKQGCSCCQGRTIVQGINDISTTAPWMIPYFQGGIEQAKQYTHSSHKKIIPICPYCGKLKDKEIQICKLYSRKSIACICGDGFSYGHKYIYNILKQLNLKFKSNETLEWCKFYNPYKGKECVGEYDFVLENDKLIIEVDGSLHRKNNPRSGMKKEESEFLDHEKDRLAEENGYYVIRIIYEDEKMEIKSYILNSKLVNIYDSSLVDWLECEDFASKNIVKLVCDYWKNERKCNENTESIGSIFGISGRTIRSYLNKGNKIGWISYNSK